MSSPGPAILVGLALAVAGLGCGGSDGEQGSEPAARAESEEPSDRSGDRGERSGGGASDQPKRPASETAEEPRPTEVEAARCPANAGNCESATGRIIFVEAVDPDGDGDAHFVLLSDESITAPGISVIDVRLDLRPEPLPGIGDTISAAGPVFPGSYGQSQIQADVLNVGAG
ncbi:MAG: hypothetical protein ACR2N5_03100 [Solirubrobacterales bacterium]